MVLPDQQHRPIIKLDGSELDRNFTDKLLEVRVVRALQVPTRIFVRFSDPDFKLAADGKVKVGAAISVAFKGGDVLSQGEVTDLEIDQRAGERPELILVGYDKSHRLGRVSTTKVFKDVSFADMVTQLVGPAGLSVEADSTEQTFPWMLQAGTAADQLAEICRRCGYDWYVDGSTLKFKKPGPDRTVKLTNGKDLSSFSVRGAAHFPNKVTVRGWDPKQKEAVNGPNKANGSALPDSALAKKIHDGNKQITSEVTTTLGGASVKQEAETISSAIADRAVRAAVTAMGTCSPNANLIPGGAVVIENAGPGSGTYFLSGVEHVFLPSGTVTRFTAGDRAPTGLADSLGHGRQGGIGSGDYDGLMIGLVTANDDPDKGSRVKVKLPALGDTIESDWCRVITFGAGKDRGSVWLPEVGDEVLVGFEGGDLRKGVILGSLYNGKDTPAKHTVESGQVVTRQLTSRLGHHVELSDGAAATANHILLKHAKDKAKLRLGDDETTLDLPAGNPLTINVGSTKIAVDKSGNVTIETDTNIELKSAANMSLEGANVTIKAKAQLSLEGAMFTLKGSGSGEVNGGGMLALKGGVVQIN